MVALQVVPEEHCEDHEGDCPRDNPDDGRDDFVAG
jgi:hypothetical protein